MLFMIDHNYKIFFLQLRWRVCSFESEYELRATLDVSLRAAFRLINGIERFSSSWERNITNERIRRRARQSRSQWPDGKVWRKVKATKFKSKKAQLRSILWPVEVTGPAIVSWRNRRSRGFESLDFQTGALYINLSKLFLRS